MTLPPVVALQVVPTPLAAGTDLHLLVRSLHVLAVTVLLGGAVFAWIVLHRFDRPRQASAAREVATAYEWLFWGAVGVLVMTGVGNLGALAPTLPDGATAWGRTLALKLALALAFVLGSVVRTLAVAGWSRHPSARSVPEGIRTSYAATTATLVVLLALAEVLAHG